MKLPVAYTLATVDSAHGSVKGAGDDRDLRGPAPCPPGGPDSEIDEKIAHPGKEHEAGKENVNEEDVRGNSGEEAEHPFVSGDEENLHHPGKRIPFEFEEPGPIGGRDQVKNGDPDGNGHPPRKGPPAGLDNQDDQRRPQKDLDGQNLIDPDHAVIEAVGVPERVKRPGKTEEGGDDVEEARPVFGGFGGGRVKDVDHREEEHEVQAPHGPRFKGAEPRGIEVQQRSGNPVYRDEDLDPAP